ncbi:MAG: hypothetical protein Q9174_001209, partial [Haloplaca sp. 1 TL-2023]
AKSSEELESVPLHTSPSHHPAMAQQWRDSPLLNAREMRNAPILLRHPCATVWFFCKERSGVEVSTISSINCSRLLHALGTPRKTRSVGKNQIISQKQQDIWSCSYRCPSHPLAHGETATAASLLGAESQRLKRSNIQPGIPSLAA